MDKAAAQKLVQTTLEASFNKERFVSLLKNMLNRFNESKARHFRGHVKEKFRTTMPIIKTYERVGTYTDSKDRKTDLLIVYLQKENSIERARTSLRNFVADYLQHRGMKDAALVAFVAPNGADWRFSFVKMEYRFNKKGKVEDEFTPARRYSFLVGENENSHTAQSRLLPILLKEETDPTLDELEDAFSVEPVTKEFFEKYRDLFWRLKESLEGIVKKDATIKADFKAKNVQTDDFAKKLLGQIVFLYFLQKKGWFGVKRGKDWGSGSKHFLRELFDRKHRDYNNFFNDILEPLFYEALRLERPKDYYDQFKCRIPFLNGGLFDPINDYDWQDTDIEIPDDIFSNSRTTKEGDSGDGVLDIFDRYNFTVKEDEPMEKEVAVDPEMLGKVFENLLVVKDRKSKGTYYTPREIVHYMCQQSLINYLYSELNHGVVAYEKIGDRQTGMLGNEAKKNQLDLTIEHRSQPLINKEDIETLIQYGETSVEHDTTHRKKTAKNAKYRGNYNKAKLPKSIAMQARRIDEKLESIRVCDPAVGSGAFVVGMMNEIIRTRNALTSYIGENRERVPYHFKWQAIQHCLYGVDIDPGAVEIAKLRLWLSLVVDEEERETIQPLPNLDYKIVQGNSLLNINKLFHHQSSKQVEELKTLYFKETSASKKQKHKKRIDELIIEITAGHKEFDFEVYFSEIFHEKKGFDVVIANPPYDVINDKKFRKIYADTIYGRANLYGLFIHKSVRDIVKPFGHLTFINPKTLLADKYFINLRKFLNRNGNFKTILKIADRHRVFENVLQSVIVHIFQRQEAPSQEDRILMHEIRKRSDIENIKNRFAAKADNIWLGEKFDSCILVSDKEEVYSIFDKIRDNTTPFLQSGIQFTTGKIQWNLFKKQLTEKPVAGSVRLLWAENIQRYRFCASGKRKGKEFIKGPLTIRPNITTKTVITQRTTADEQEYRIIATIFDPQTEGFNAFSENHTNYLAPNSKTFEAEFVLGLLNAQFFDFLFRHINSNTQVSSGELNSLPIKEFSLLDQRPVINLVGKILAITKDDDYLQNPTKKAKVCDYEKQIDQLVYQLYGLTDKEIQIVENHGR